MKTKMNRIDRMLEKIRDNAHAYRRVRGLRGKAGNWYAEKRIERACTIYRLRAANYWQILADLLAK